MICSFRPAGTESSSISVTKPYGYSRLRISISLKFLAMLLPSFSNLYYFIKIQGKGEISHKRHKREKGTHPRILTYKNSGVRPFFPFVPFVANFPFPLNLDKIV